MQRSRVIQPIGNSTTSYAKVATMIPQQFQVRARTGYQVQISGPSATILTGGRSPPLSTRNVDLGPISFVPSPRQQPRNFHLQATDNGGTSFDNAGCTHSIKVAFIASGSICVRNSFGLRDAAKTENNVIRRFARAL